MLGHAGVQAPRRDYNFVIVLQSYARSCRCASTPSRLSLSTVCSFGANLLHLGNVSKQVYCHFLGLRLFHVKPYEASEAGTSIFVSISEPIKVGHAVSKHNQGYYSLVCSFVRGR